LKNLSLAKVDSYTTPFNPKPFARLATQILNHAKRPGQPSRMGHQSDTNLAKGLCYLEDLRINLRKGTCPSF
jgi:hypothetical protein